MRHGSTGAIKDEESVVVKYQEIFSRMFETVCMIKLCNNMFVFPVNQVIKSYLVMRWDQ